MCLRLFQTKKQFFYEAEINYEKIENNFNGTEN